MYCIKHSQNMHLNWDFDHSLQGWCKDSCTKEKGTFMVGRRNTATFKYHAGLRYQQVFRYVQILQCQRFQEGE